MTDSLISTPHSEAALPAPRFTETHASCAPEHSTRQAPIPQLIPIVTQASPAVQSTRHELAAAQDNVCILHASASEQRM